MSESLCHGICVEMFYTIMVVVVIETQMFEKYYMYMYMYIIQIFHVKITSRGEIDLYKTISK